MTERQHYFLQDLLIGLINGIALSVIKVYIGPLAFAGGAICSLVTYLVLTLDTSETTVGIDKKMLSVSVGMNFLFLIFGANLGYLMEAAGLGGKVASLSNALFSKFFV